MISSTIIKTVRFALPLIPLLAIFSAFGVYQIYLLLPKSFNKVIITTVILCATIPALKNTLHHNSLMQGNDTLDFLQEIREVLRKNTNAIQIILDDKQFFDKTPNLDDPEYLNRCNSEPKDFKAAFKFQEYPNIIVSTNSYQLDRFIFDKTYHCKNNHKAFTNYSDLRVLQISPFTLPKQDVPFSFISNFPSRWIFRRIIFVFLSKLS